MDIQGLNSSKSPMSPKSSKIPRASRAMRDPNLASEPPLGTDSLVQIPTVGDLGILGALGALMAFDVVGALGALKAGSRLMTNGAKYKSFRTNDGCCGEMLSPS